MFWINYEVFFNFSPKFPTPTEYKTTFHLYSDSDSVTIEKSLFRTNSKSYYKI